MTWTIITEEEEQKSKDRHTQLQAEELMDMKVCEGLHHLLEVKYDFLGSDEEAERLIEDFEEIDMAYDVRHPEDCIEDCRRVGMSDHCSVHWLIGYVGIEDAFGNVPMPFEPGEWEIEFHVEGHGDDVEARLVFLEDEQ